MGRCRETWLQCALAEYEKRLQATLQIEWLIAKNNAQLIDWAREEPFLIALDPKGDLLESEKLSRKLHSLLREKGSRLQFIIGGAEGIPPEIECHWRWSLSPLTFTHQMVRLLLAEQLYRALDIEKGSGYHK